MMGFGLVHSKGSKIEIIDSGILNLSKEKDHFVKIKKIFEFVIELIDKHNPDELAIESPFYSKNIQSMLKLGRAQGAAISASLSRELPIFEYSPRKIKQSITGKGSASKEQVAGMITTMFGHDFSAFSFDASDAVGVAICHCLQNKISVESTKYSSWSSFISQNPDRIVKKK